MKLYKDGQLVGEFSTTELKELAGVDIEKAADVAFEAVEVKNFEVGDKVEVVGVSVTGRDECIGETAVITYIDEEGDIQLVEGDGNNGWYPPSSLKLIEEEPEEVLSYENVKIGEVVYCNGAASTIVSEDDNGGDYWLKRIANGESDLAETKQLRHATEEEKSHLQTLIGREKDEYKIGDLVELLSGAGSGYRGRDGYIFEVDGISRAFIHLKDKGNKTNENDTYIHQEKLKLITPVEWRHDFVEEVK